MNRRTIALGGLALVIVAVFAVRSQPLDTHPSDVLSLYIEPYPEGPPGPTFTREPPANPGSLTFGIEPVERFIPNPLPRPRWQGFFCRFGGNLFVTLQDGRVIRYGPCKRPASIDALWAHMLDVFSEGTCRPRCGPG